jgi:hypothetical protein
VVALSVPEFACDLDVRGALSLDAVCRRFVEDSNKAVVWFIRFHAFTAWCEGPDVAVWLLADPSRAQRATELAAGFELNDEWRFDAERFRSAVESVVR